MKPSTWLRAASVITMLTFAGHSSGFPWTPAVGPSEVPVLDAMKGHSFAAMGSQRSYWDFYLGFGLMVSVYMLLQAVLLWQLAAMAKADAARVRPLVASFFVAFVVNAVLGWKYFFALPAVMAGATAVCLAMAFVGAGRGEA